MKLAETHLKLGECGLETGESVFLLLNIYSKSLDTLGIQIRPLYPCELSVACYA